MEFYKLPLSCVIVGDALLAFWCCDKNNQQETVTKVMENGLSIQENYDNFKAGDGINLRMKISISVGDIFVYHLGMNLLYVLFVNIVRVRVHAFVWCTVCVIFLS